MSSKMSEAFEDTDGGTSMKRVGFFMFACTAVFVVVMSVFGFVAPAFIWYGLTTMILTIGGFITAERVPQAIAAITGKPMPPASVPSPPPVAQDKPA